MARTLASVLGIELNSQELKPFYALKFEFDSGSLYLWTGLGDLVADGQTWIGGAGVIGISTSSETIDLSANNVTITLNGLDSSVLAIALAEPYRGRPFTLYLGALDANNQVVAQGGANLLTWSEEFNNNDWFKNQISVTANQALAPDGTFTADKIISTQITDPYIGQGKNLGNFSGNYVFSVWLWTDPGQPTSYRFYFYRQSTTTLGQIITKDIFLTEIPTRYFITENFTSDATREFLTSRLDPSEPISGAINQYCYAWGAQLETGTTPTPYTKTTSGIITAGPLYQLFSGRMDTMSVEDNGNTANISLVVENALVDLERPRIRRLTNEEQLARFPGDQSLSGVAKLQDRQISWGRA
jgi:hypothetical protein